MINFKNETKNQQSNTNNKQEVSSFKINIYNTNINYTSRMKGDKPLQAKSTSHLLT